MHLFTLLAIYSTKCEVIRSKTELAYQIESTSNSVNVDFNPPNKFA